MRVNELREALRAIPRAEWPALAQASGVARSTIEKIAYGVTANPSHASATALIDALRNRPSMHASAGEARA